MPLRLSTGKQTDSRLNFNFTQKQPAGQYPVCRLFISPAKIRQRETRVLCYNEKKGRERKR